MSLLLCESLGEIGWDEDQRLRRLIVEGTDQPRNTLSGNSKSCHSTSSFSTSTRKHEGGQPIGG